MTNRTRFGGSPAGMEFWQRWGGLIACLVLVAGTLAVYGRALGFDFVNYDDPFYVTDNAHVQAGLSRAGLSWALRATLAANWHPVTWLSHMLDCQVYGLRAGGHHLTSILLHAANSCLLFALLLRMTGRRGRSFVVAALFAWHPLHVESVAWIAERKDVLSTCFGLLCLWAYVRYAENAEGGMQSADSSTTHHATRNTQLASSYYFLSLLCLALGLMSKPMLVTLPCVMLLLDYWPLQRSVESGIEARRFRPAGWGRLLLEKIPFLLLAALSCGTTLWAQAREGAILSVGRLPLPPRLANAVLSYYAYLGKTVWPAGLAVFYPHTNPHLSGPVVLAGMALVVFSVVALWLRKLPYVTVGWLWFAGTLVPVLGLVQVGAQAMADRYFYVPSIGLFILAVFGVSELAGRLRHGMAALTALAGVALAACLAVTWLQVGYWRNSETLYRHAIAVTRDNFIAYGNLGSALFNQGRKEEGCRLYEAAARLVPNDPKAHYNLADAYAALKRPHEAIAEYQAALKLNPRLEHEHYSLANELLATGEGAAAEEQYRAALALKPDFAEAHYQLAVALLARGQVAEASGHLREAVRLKPDWVEALNNLAWLLATQPDARLRDGTRAVALAERAVELTHTNDATLLDTLGAALAEAGRFPEAKAVAQTAARLTQASGAAQVGREIEAHRQCYDRGQPFHEPSVPAPPAVR